MKPHLAAAHGYWKKILHPSDTVIDATCGNGKDTRILAELVPQGRVFALDIQQTGKVAGLPNVTFLHQSHERLPTMAKLVVYNLGYLPGGDKSITTMTETTLASLRHALELASHITVVCYPGHPEGAKEELAIERFCQGLEGWAVSWQKWRDNSPSLLILSIKKFNYHL